MLFNFVFHEEYDDLRFEGHGDGSVYETGNLALFDGVAGG